MSKGLFLLVEGPDDARFVDKILKPLLQKKYSWIKTYLYAEKKQRQINSFLQSIRRMNSDYAFLTDLDLSPCITFKKEKSREKYSALDLGSIFVVKCEIEGWYLAGIPNNECLVLDIQNQEHTNDLTKEDFNHIIPKRFNSRIDFMQELLKVYVTSLAREKNISFQYFLHKHGL